MLTLCFGDRRHRLGPEQMMPAQVGGFAKWCSEHHVSAAVQGTEHLPPAFVAALPRLQAELSTSKALVTEWEGKHGAAVEEANAESQRVRQEHEAEVLQLRQER